MAVVPAMRQDQIRTFLREVFEPHLNPKAFVYRDAEVDPVVLEVKNFKCVYQIEPSELMFEAIQVLLDQSNLHKTPVLDWNENIKRRFAPFRSLWTYTKNITDAEDRTDCIMNVFEYCSNPKRPHLQRGFPHIVSSLLAGDILCPVSAANFVDAMLRSDEDSERQVGHTMQPMLSQSSPW